MLVNNESSSLSNRVGDQFGIGENSYCILTDQHAWPDKANPLHQSVWSLALSTMTE